MVCLTVFNVFDAGDSVCLRRVVNDVADKTAINNLHALTKH